MKPLIWLRTNIVEIGFYLRLQITLNYSFIAAQTKKKSKKVDSNLDLQNFSLSLKYMIVRVGRTNSLLRIYLVFSQRVFPQQFSMHSFMYQNQSSCSHGQHSITVKTVPIVIFKGPT